MLAIINPSKFEKISIFFSKKLNKVQYGMYEMLINENIIAIKQDVKMFRHFWFSKISRNKTNKLWSPT